MLPISKHRWKTILLCIGAAVVFWFLNALSKVYTTEIDYPVSFVINTSQVVFEKSPPSTLRIEVKGSGWRLLRYLTHLNVHPVEIPVVKVLEKSQIKAEYLDVFFFKRLQDLKVNRVFLDETLRVCKTPSNSPKD